MPINRVSQPYPIDQYTLFCWSFDESSSPWGCTGTGAPNNITPNSGTTTASTTDAVHGQALEILSGSSTGVSSTPGGFAPIYSHPCTFSYWFKSDTILTNKHLFWAHEGGFVSLAVIYTIDGQIGIFCSNQLAWTQAGVIQANKWNFITTVLPGDGTLWLGVFPESGPIYWNQIISSGAFFDDPTWGITLTPAWDGPITTNFKFDDFRVDTVARTYDYLYAKFLYGTNPITPSLHIISGNQQSTIINAEFAHPLIAQLTLSTSPITSTLVQFAAVPNIDGASASLNPTSAFTDNNGEVSTIATANGIVGEYTVSASSSGTSSINYTLSNTRSTLEIVSGSVQSSIINTQFKSALIIRLLNGSDPVTNTLVQFAAVPNLNGASASLVPSSGLTDSNGEVSVIATANGAVGSYIITASYMGGNSVNFILSNTSKPKAKSGSSSTSSTTSAVNPNPISLSNRMALLVGIQSFMSELMGTSNGAPQRIAGYNIDAKSLNTASSISQGLYQISLSVKTLSSMDDIVLDAVIGETVEVTQGT